MKRLRCGLLGLAGEGQALLDAVVANPTVELVAVGDPEHPALRPTAEKFGAQAFEDCRSLLVEAPLEVVFVALPPYQAGEYLRTPAQRGVGVFQLAPWALDFEAAAELAHLFDGLGCPYVIARPWQTERAFDRLRDVREALGRVYAIDVDVVAARLGREGWLGDAQRAGGGTLLHDTYEQIDLVLTLCGLPEQVYAAAGWLPGPAEPRPYDTEDAMSVICKYSQDRFATITSCRAAAALKWKVTLRGTAATARVLPKSVRVTNSAGERIAEVRVRSRNRYSLAVNAFVTAMLEGTKSISPSAREHLPTMALMQAAYLSAKTGHPESPATFLDLTRKT